MNTTIDGKLVMRANELYHDLEGVQYDDRHPEIFISEHKRWLNLCAFLGNSSRSALTILDYGCGTGFVSQTLSKMMRPEDRLICCDISQNMLDVCAQKNAEQDLQCEQRFIKITGEAPYLPESVTPDVICANSVLHHLPDPYATLKSLIKSIRPGGYLIIGHEPNLLFYTSRGHVLLFKMMGFCFNSTMRRQPFKKVLAKLGLLNTLRNRFSNHCERHRMLEKINQQLVAENLITAPLSLHQIEALVDFHSATAIEASYTGNPQGLDWKRIDDENKDIILEHIETYNHVGGVSETNVLTRTMDRLLSKRDKERGAIFSVVYRKAQASA